MNRLAVWIALGIALRLVLMPAYVHPDLRGFNFAAYLISQKSQILSFYDYPRLLSPSHQLLRLYHRDLFIYPPLAYLTPSLFMFVLGPFYSWPAFLQLVYDFSQAFFHPHLLRDVFLLKLPFLVADLVCLTILLRLVSAQNRFTASIFWLFNPVTLYATYLIGQFDIYLALFVLIGLYQAQRHRHLLSSGFVAAAAAFKPFPLFFLPFLPGSKIKNVAVGLLVYLLLISPYLPSPAFRQFALFAPQSQKISSNPLFLGGISILFLTFLMAPGKLPFWGWPGAVTLLFYSTTHFHPQWLVWGLPFLALSFSLIPKTRIHIAILFVLYFLFVATFEPSLNADILRLSAPLRLSSMTPAAIKALFSLSALLLIVRWRQ